MWLQDKWVSSSAVRYLVAGGEGGGAREESAFCKGSLVTVMYHLKRQSQIGRNKCCIC